jgi:DNA-binding MarR family transcriptional regulator
MAISTDQTSAGVDNAVAERPKGSSPATTRPRSRAKRQRNVELAGLDSHVGYAVRRAQVAVFQDFMRAVAETGIRPAQFSILTVIAANPGLKQADVSRALGIERGRLVLVLHELERRGLARRAASEVDRRSHALHLTPKGERLLAQLNVVVGDHERRMSAKLGPEDKARLMELLQRLVD